MFTPHPAGVLSDLQGYNSFLPKLETRLNTLRDWLHKVPACVPRRLPSRGPRASERGNVGWLFRYVCGLYLSWGLRSVWQETLSSLQLQAPSAAAVLHVLRGWGLNLTRANNSSCRGSTDHTLPNGGHLPKLVFSIVCLQAACITVKNMQMVLSLLMATTHVACATVTEGTLSAPGSHAMETAATLTSHQDNAVENVNVCRGKIQLTAVVWSFFPWINKLNLIC